MKKLIHQLTRTIILLMVGYTGLHAQIIGTVPYFAIISPNEVSEIYASSEGFYTASVSTGWGGDLTNSTIIAPLKFAEVGTDTLVCDSINVSDFTGKIAIIPRGGCEFGRKALNAQQHGALAVIIVSNAASPVGMGAGSVGNQVTIPVIMVGSVVGQPLLTVLKSGEDVYVSLGASPEGFTMLEGDVQVDENVNCINDPGEPSVKGMKIGIQTGIGNMHIRQTDSTGHYRIFVNPAQSPFVISPITNNQGWGSCPASSTVTTSTPDTIVRNFALESVYDCVQLEAEIYTPVLRRCFSSPYTATVCNNGTATAQNAYAIVTLPPQIGPIEVASIPYTTVSPGIYRFDLANLSPFECTTFTFNAPVSCDSLSLLGQTLCYRIHAYPDTSCTQPSQAWNGANITVNATCDGDNVRFTIKNNGIGNMTQPLDYIVIQDDVMYMTVPFQLNAGQTVDVQVPADGSTWRLEASQVPNHPINGNPSESVEGCTVTGVYNIGYFLMFPLDEEGPAIDERCQLVVGSYDPNDKQGFPTGYTEARLIRPEVDIDYLIRFQNTGNDTAFTVVIRDTLSPALDPLSVRSVISSHPYRMEINDQKLVFRFDNILLVDSFTNEPASHGFVSFKISQRPNNPYGTSIDNRAGIYFDFNPPVITNTTHHEVGEVIGIVAAKEIPGQTPPLVYPNPVSANAILQLQGDQFANATYTFFDLQGRLVHSGQVINNRVPVTGTSSGMYILKLVTEGGERYAVKVILK